MFSKKKNTLLIFSFLFLFSPNILYSQSLELSDQNVSFNYKNIQNMWFTIGNDNYFEYDIHPKYDVTSGSYVTKRQQNLNSSVDGSFWSPNGDTLWVADQNDDAIKEFETSGSYDYSSATLSESLTYNSNDPIAIEFRGNGNDFFFLSDGNDRLYHYNTTKSFSISGATKSDTLDFANTYSYMTDRARDFEFNDDGKRLYYLNGEDIHQFDLSTAWDISSANVSDTFSINLIRTDSLETNITGSQFYVSSYDSDEKGIYEINNTTNFEISSSTLGDSLYVGSEVGDLVSIQSLIFTDEPQF